VGSGKENGEAVFFVAREGAALPLVDFDFKYFDLKILTFLTFVEKYIILC